MYHESDDEVFVVEPDNDMVPLDSPDPEFVRGIEVGVMWQAAIYGFDTHMKIHASNIEMVLRICDAYELIFSAEDTEDPDMIIVSLCPPDNCDYDDDDSDD